MMLRMLAGCIWFVKKWDWVWAIIGIIQLKKRMHSHVTILKFIKLKHNTPMPDYYSLHERRKLLYLPVMVLCI